MAAAQNTLPLAKGRREQSCAEVPRGLAAWKGLHRVSGKPAHATPRGQQQQPGEAQKKHRPGRELDRRESSQEVMTPPNQYVIYTRFSFRLEMQLFLSSGL